MSVCVWGGGGGGGGEGEHQRSDPSRKGGLGASPKKYFLVQNVCRSDAEAISFWFQHKLYFKCLRQLFLTPPSMH